MHTVIYIPGLGDHRSAGQRAAISTWRLWGVRPYFFQMNWNDDRSFEPKLEALLADIDRFAKKGKVSIVSASAGASAALNAYALRPDKITGVACIAGKINNPQAIGGSYKVRNPSFYESAQRTTGSIGRLTTGEKRRVLTIRAMFDEVIPARDSQLEGARNRMTWTSGHAITIATQLVFGAPFFIRFLKQQ